MKKRIENKINDSIENSKSYDDIKSKLDFDSFSNEQVVIPKKKFKLVATISSIVAVLTITFLIVFIPSINRKANNIFLTPISEELEAFYLKCFYSETEPDPEMEVSYLYYLYKEYGNLYYLNNSYETTFKKSKDYTAYYASENVYQVMKKINYMLNDSFSDYSHGLEYYYDCVRYCGHVYEELRNEPLMIYVFSNDNKTLPETTSNHYHLIDITVEYSSEDLINTPFIDFVDYEISDGDVTITTTNKPNRQKTLICITPNDGYRLWRRIKIYAFLVDVIDNKEILIETFGGDDKTVLFPSPYYDELKDCVISIEIADTIIQNNGTIFVRYKVTYDYEKIKTLLGFYLK